MTSFKKIIVDSLYEHQILRITLNSPKGNILDREMMMEITAVIEKQVTSSPFKAVLFQGAGKHFSFGASIQEHQKENVKEMLHAFHQLFRAMVVSSKPYLALLQGQCLGGALELASFCHWIFATEDTNLGQPEINLGVFPPLACLILPHKIGQPHAEDLILSGRTLSGLEAKELGLVYSVSSDPQQELFKFLETYLLPKSAIALQIATKATRFTFYKKFLEQLEDLERLYLQELMQTEDASEGIQAFLEKRTPVWKNL
jgi:cyclohexa-1,5-dienecarbonyl-CoA hydratase